MKNCTVTVEKPSKYICNQVIRLSSPGMSCGDQVTPDMTGEEGNFTSAVSLTGTHSSSLIKSKTTEKARLWDILQDTWPVSLMRKKKNNRKNWASVPDQRTLGDVPAQCSVMSWTGSWNANSSVQSTVIKQHHFHWQRYHRNIKCWTRKLSEEYSLTPNGIFATLL